LYSANIILSWAGFPQSTLVGVYIYMTEEYTLTIDDVARIANVARPSVYVAEKRGTLTSNHKVRMYKLSEVQAWVAQLKANPCRRFPTKKGAK